MLGQPSRTAYAAAAHRAAHQILEKGSVFSDPFAIPILNRVSGDVVREDDGDPSRRRMRLFVAIRSRFAEDMLGNAVARGVRQYVVLGAGLDTFAYRNPHRGLQVFEADHPATQAWKRQSLAGAGIVLPETLTFAPIDFERQSVTEALVAARFNAAEPAFVSWLGVIPYLTEDAIFATLTSIANLAPGTQVVFDYGEPPSSRAREERAELEERAATVAELGEPWITFFEPEVLARKLAAAGFLEIQDFSPTRIVRSYLPGRILQTRDRGGHLVLAGN